MPKQTKSNKKVVASNAKQSNKFTQKFKSIPLFGKLLVSLVLLAGIAYGGWYGYNTYKANDLKAKAGAWSQYAVSDAKLNGKPLWAVWACQYRSNTGAPGVKVLTIDQRSKVNSYLEIGKGFTKQKGSFSPQGMRLRNASSNGQYLRGISGIQLSHSQADSFFVDFSASTNVGGVVRLYWSYSIWDLAWC